MSKGLIPLAVLEVLKYLNVPDCISAMSAIATAGIISVLENENEAPHDSTRARPAWSEVIRELTKGRLVQCRLQPCNKH